MPSDELHRRATDAISDQHEIELLIAKENDPKMRLQLMVQNRLNAALIANTETINSVSKRLHEHLTKYEAHTAKNEALINQGKGAWRVVAWVIGGVQVVGLAIWVYANEEIKEMHIAMVRDQEQHEVIRSRITVLEEKIK